MGKNQHVVKTPDGWGVRGEHNTRITQKFDTQKEAIAKAREIAINQKSELFIHGENGRIRERNSYGNDPYPPRDNLRSLPHLNRVGYFLHNILHFFLHFPIRNNLNALAHRYNDYLCKANNCRDKWG